MTVGHIGCRLTERRHARYFVQSLGSCFSHCPVGDGSCLSPLFSNLKLYRFAVYTSLEIAFLSI
jgi:hypothetical protein